MLREGLLYEYNYKSGSLGFSVVPPRCGGVK